MDSLYLFIGLGFLVILSIWQLILVLNLAGRLENLQQESEEKISTMLEMVTVSIREEHKSIKENQQEIERLTVKTYEMMLRLYEKPANKNQPPINTSLMADVMTRVKEGQDRVTIAQETGINPGEIDLIRGLSHLIDKS